MSCVFCQRIVGGELLSESERAAGYNLGVNVGAAAGQTVDHAHLHVIPRYAGDVAEPRGGIRWIIPAKGPLLAGDLICEASRANRFS
jgi:hypothetical protein